MFLLKKWFLRQVDSYILNYHSQDYIRKDLIQDEITRRIDSAIEVNNKIRDEQEELKIESISLEFEIQEKGWVAEIEKYEKIIEEIMELRKDTMKLRHRTYQYAKEIAMVAAENNHEGENIINQVGKSIGEYTKITRKAINIVSEIEGNKKKDDNALRI